MKEIGKSYRARLKAEVFAHYGKSCACCGESEIRFLTLDHINDDGVGERRKLSRGKRYNAYGSGANFYVWLKRNGYPEGLRVLCFNCNCARAHNKGICPHQEMLVG